MPHILDKCSKCLKKVINYRSSIFRVLILALCFVTYYFLLSPFVENFFVVNIAEAYREKSTVEVNSLSPVFDIYAYAGNYNLSSYNKTSTTSSRTAFFTLDSRILAMNKFLNAHNSPMADYSYVFVQSADTYGLDWRLVASISGIESAFGNLIPAGSYNGWGWRGKNGNDAGWSMFDGWEDSISHVTERIALGYGTNLTPFDMEATYCPPCGENPAHVWANTVTNYMEELQYYLDNLESL